MQRAEEGLRDVSEQRRAEQDEEGVETECGKDGETKRDEDGL